MPKFSVKRPYIILVAVLVLGVLGVVGFSRMTTDFLPEMNLPYMMVTTPYPGASPQKVESEVTTPVENAVSTISGVKNVTSTSSANVSVVSLEFEQSTDMDSAMVKITTALNQAELPDEAGKPSVLEASSDMMPVMVFSVDKKGMDRNELTQHINDDILPQLKRQEGVASVQGIGLVEDSVEIKLNQKKIDDVNKRILAETNDKLADAKVKLDKAQDKLDSAKSKIKKQQDKLAKTQKKQAGELGKFNQMVNQGMEGQIAMSSQLQSLSAYQSALSAQKSALEQNVKTLENTPGGTSLPEYKQAKESLAQVEGQLSQVSSQLTALKSASDKLNKQMEKAVKNTAKVEAGKISAAAAFGVASAQMASVASTLESSQKELDSGYDSYEESAKTARKNANANKLIAMDTLSGIISAENFSMPAGYIKGGKAEYLLRIDEENTSAKDVENLVLTHISGVGDIRVEDVADVKYVDNSDDTYAKVNGRDASVLVVYKSSSASSSAVSDTMNDKLDSLEKTDSGLHFTTLMDQGEYIDVIIQSVFSNLIWGAILAFLVLLLFLRDLRPTLVVAASIPLSVLFAILLMYFSDMTLNIISLSGLALGIGMLVDNSIVVMENIYRIKAQGVSSARAAVMGANQVMAAIAASTLTTICVFLPVVFTDGITRELISDMCLTITFSLLASLAVALTVVPALSSTLLRNRQPKEHRQFERMLNGYERALRWSLKHKAVPLLIAVGLLAFCGWRVTTTGVVMLPDMGSTQLTMNMTADADSDTEEDYATIDKISKEVQKIDGVDTVGSMQSTSLGMGGAAGSSNKSYMTMVLLDDDYYHKNKEISRKIEKILGKYNLKDYSVSGSTMDTSQMMGSGLTVNIFGDEDSKLLKISDDVMKMAEDTGGFKDLTNGQEEGTKEIVLNINKDKAMRKGLTVAQIYQSLAAKLTTDKKASTITVNGDILDVNIKDSRKELTKSNLLDYKIEATTTAMDGTQKTKKYRLGDFASYKVQDSVSSITHDNGSKLMTVTGAVKDGYNTTLQSRKLEKKLKAYDLPSGYRAELAGETESVQKMLKDMGMMMAVSLILIYLIMVGQFASFFSPFIVMFTIPLAATGGFLAMMIAGEQLSVITLMGFLILSGVVVNNGIVFIDYVNRLRKEGKSKVEALVESGRTRMRPILMTALTTILAMSVMAVSQDQGSEMGRGMAVVTIGGLAYATLMTLFIVPILYDLFQRREMKHVDLGDESTLNAAEGEEL